MARDEGGRRRRRRNSLFPHDGTELPTFFLCGVAPAFASGNVMPRPWRKGSRAGEARGCADCRAAPIRRQGRQGDDGWGETRGTDDGGAEAASHLRGYIYAHRAAAAAVGGWDGGCVKRAERRRQTLRHGVDGPTPPPLAPTTATPEPRRRHACVVRWGAVPSSSSDAVPRWSSVTWLYPAGFELNFTPAARLALSG